MMTPILMAACAFSLGLLAFCAGIALTVWCGANSGNESVAGKLGGYFVIVLAILALIVTSYHAARILFGKDMMGDDMMMSQPMEGKHKKGGMMRHNEMPRAN